VSAPVAEHAGEGLPNAALAGMLLAASLAPLGSTMIAVALPSIGRDIGADASDLTQWLVSSYLIASIALQSPGGKLGDLIGHGRALIAGLSLVAAGGLVGLLVGTVHLLGVARLLMASGGAATVPATMAILRNQTSADRRARVFGVFATPVRVRAAAGRRPTAPTSVIPFLVFRNVHLALRLSNLVALVMLFITGSWLARHGGHNPLWTGLAMMLLGVVLVGITIALGG